MVYLDLFSRRIIFFLIAITASIILNFDTTSQACDIFSEGKDAKPRVKRAPSTGPRTAAQAEQEVVAKFAANMHDVSWLPPFVKQNGPKAHQPKPLDEAWLPQRLVQALKQFQRHPHIYVDAEGKVVQNIAQDSPQLITQLNLKLNGKLAGAFASSARRAIEERRDTDIEAISAEFHVIYMKANTWQLESVFEKLAGDKNKVYNLELPDLLAYLGELTAEQLAKLTSEEKDRIAQFKNYGDLTDSQKDLDREKVKEVLAYFGDATSGTQKTAAEVEEAVTARYAASMHDVSWLPPFVEQNGPKAHQPKPLDQTWIPARLWEVLTTGYGARYRGIYVLSDGTIVQNIAQPSQFLVPELNLKLNGKLAGAFARITRTAIEQGKENDIESMAAEFHVVYMEQNTWQLESVFEKLSGDKNTVYSFESVSALISNLANLTPEQIGKLSAEEVDRVAQFKDYADLTEPQKELDRKKVEEVLKYFEELMG